MAAPYNPPTKNDDFKMRIALQDANNPESFKANPTIAAGDFKISIDGGALANLTNLPTVEPAASIWVEIILTSGEMNGDDIAIQAIDQTSPKEWSDWAINILTTA